MICFSFSNFFLAGRLSREFLGGRAMADDVSRVPMRWRWGAARLILDIRLERRPPRLGSAIPPTWFSSAPRPQSRSRWDHLQGWDWQIEIERLVTPPLQRCHPYTHGSYYYYEGNLTMVSLIVNSVYQIRDITCDMYVLQQTQFNKNNDNRQ
jgi:hypothetical protein